MTKKKQLSREGQIGLVLILVAMIVSVAVGSLVGLLGLFCGLAGIYILTHKDSLAWLSGRKA